MNLKMLAKELGLSQTTVSRALNGYPEVKEETRLRVEAAAIRLGYRPNVSARRLATGRVGAIGMVLPSQGGFLQNPHFSEFLAGLGERLAREEFDIVVTPVDSSDELPSFKRIWADKRVDAMIVGMPKLKDERVDLLTELGVPFIVHGRTEGKTPHAWFDIDNEDAFRRATSHLLDLGHTRIALSNGPVGRTFTEHRERGYRKALAARGVEVDPALIDNGELTDEVGFAIARKFLAAENAPTAILSSSVTMALGAFRAMRSNGLALGQDISMIAHDDVFPYLNADRMVPTLSTTRSSIRAAGTRVGELVLEMLEGRAPETIHETWPVDLVIGESTGPAPR